MPSWLIELVIAAGAAGAAAAAAAWFFPAPRDSKAPGRRALASGGSIAVVLTLMISADHLWPHSWAASLAAAVSAVILVAAARGVAGRLGLVGEP